MLDDCITEVDIVRIYNDLAAKWTDMSTLSPHHKSKLFECIESAKTATMYEMDDLSDLSPVVIYSFKVLSTVSIRHVITQGNKRLAWFLMMYILGKNLELTIDCSEEEAILVSKDAAFGVDFFDLSHWAQDKLINIDEYNSCYPDGRKKTKNSLPIDINDYHRWACSMTKCNEKISGYVCIEHCVGFRKSHSNAMSYTPQTRCKKARSNSLNCNLK